MADTQHQSCKVQTVLGKYQMRNIFPHETVLAVQKKDWTKESGTLVKMFTQFKYGQRKLAQREQNVWLNQPDTLVHTTYIWLMSSLFCSLILKRSVITILYSKLLNRAQIKRRVFMRSEQTLMSQHKKWHPQRLLALWQCQLQTATVAKPLCWGQIIRIPLQPRAVTLPLLLACGEHRNPGPQRDDLSSSALGVFRLMPSDIKITDTSVRCSRKSRVLHLRPWINSCTARTGKAGATVQDNSTNRPRSPECKLSHIFIT